MSLSYRERAAQIMEHLCTHSSHGYSQPNRMGTGVMETVTLSDGSTYQISLGDRDCSSAVIDAWDTACPGSTGKATYTGNMRSEFTKHGFTWHRWGDGYQAQRGDVYLNESRHTAMCIGNGKLGEFSRSENHSITGKIGDQDGWESHITNFYNYSAGWDGVLAYNENSQDDKEQNMAKVFVICGHGEGDSGAVGGGYTEANLVRELANRMKKLGGDAVQVGDTSKNWYADNLISKGWCPAGVPVIELHMDSASASARGGHVIIKSGFAADSIDNALANFISSFFPGRSQSIVGRSDLANVNRAAKMGVNYRLVENGFISNSNDRNKFINQMDDLARGILNCFGISTSTPTPEPEPEPTPEPKPPLPDALKSYTDLDSEAWYVNAIEFVVKNHWMSGYSSTTFGPNDALTRAQAVCVIANVAGMEPDEPFEDVKASPYYYKAVEWAEENGIVNGNDGKFHPEDPCSRQDFACMLHNYFDNPAPKGQPTDYTDWNDVADYAKNAVAWCVEQGIISGSNGKLNPTGNCTRAECASMLYNADKAGLI